MTFLAFIRKNLLERRARSLLTISGLAVAVTTIVALVGVSWRFEEMFLEHYGGSGSGFVVQRRGGTQRLNSGLDEKLGDRLKQLPNAARVIGTLMDVVALEQHRMYAVIVNGWPHDSLVYDRIN